MNVFYLHGFASTPASGKAAFFADHLAAHGLELQRPDFNLPEFATLTITRMLDQLDAAIDAGPEGPVALIGSSLGGFVALHAAERRAGLPGASARPISRLVLLAPAVDFGSPRDEHLGPAEVRRWRAEQWHDVFHYGYERQERVHVELYEDAARHDTLALRAAVPMLIFQGVRDEVVNPRSVIEFAADRPTACLRLLDDGHQLQGCLDLMWEETARFLGLTPAS